MKPQLDAQTVRKPTRTYARQLWVDLQRHNEAAVVASRLVEHHIKRLNAYCAEMNYTDHAAREKKRTDPQLRDALDSYSLQCGNVQRVSALLTALAALRAVEGVSYEKREDE